MIFNLAMNKYSLVKKMCSFVSLKEHREYLCCKKYTAKTAKCLELAELHFLASQDDLESGYQ